MLEQRWLGRRVTVRRVLGRTPDGRTHYGDVVGDLLHVDDDNAVIDTRHGPVEVAQRSISIAKPAPPSTADELALAAVAAQGWRPAETGRVGGWLLRANGGFTNRANSVLPLKQPGMPLDDALAQARAWYRQRDLPLRLMIPTEARRLLDAELGERGWDWAFDVHTMAARLDGVDARHPAEVEVELGPAPDDAWLHRYRDGAGVQGRDLLTRHDTVVFASVRDAGRTVAVGRGTVDDGWLGVNAVEVDPGRRREGLASAVMTALWRWGREHGAARTYLQVREDNHDAVAFYTGQGYWVHHDYRYRLDPGTQVSSLR